MSQQTTIKQLFARIGANQNAHPADVYGKIVKEELHLNQEEKKELFRHYWQRLEWLNHGTFSLDEELVKKIIDRFSAEDLATLLDPTATQDGYIPTTKIAQIINICKLDKKEQIALWTEFHKNNKLQEYGRRNVRKVDQLLGILAYIRSRMSPLRKVAVLDIGCGPHATAISEIVEQFPNDVEAYAIDLVEIHAPSYVHIARGDALAIPFRDQMFDVVYSVGVLDYLGDEDWLKAIQEAHRVLARSGIFIASIVQGSRNDQIIDQLHTQLGVPIIKRRFWKRWAEGKTARIYYGRQRLIIERKS